MPSHLDTLRRVHAIAVARGPLTPVDDDLAREAGMDGNYAHLLQSARDLDAAATEPAPTTGHTPGPWRTGGGVCVIAGGDWICTLGGEHTADEEDKANARRIVACVNACEGIDDPTAALAEVRRTLRHVVSVAGDDTARVAQRTLALLGDP